MRIVVAGGGIAAVELLLALADVPALEADVELLSPGADFRFRPASVAEPFGVGRMARLDLAALTAGHGATLRRDALAAVDVAARRATAASGARLGYDALVVAVGARPRWAVAGAARFAGTGDEREVRDVLGAVADGRARRVAIAVPAGFTWPLPAYELALLTAQHAEVRGLPPLAVALVTPEPAPLAVLGGVAAEVRALLDAAGVELVCGHAPDAVVDGGLRCHDGLLVAADRVVAIPSLRGPAIEGLPADALGFLPTDPVGRVVGAPGVYGAGDAVASPVKQGALAAAQADAVADAIVAAAGLGPAPRPPRPDLRALLFTGLTARRLDAADPSRARAALPWRPAEKIGGRHLPALIAAGPAATRTGA